MPEMWFTIRWPDGSQRACYSPSQSVADHLVPGKSYPLDDFLARCRTALTAASERVRQRYGFPCSRAQAELGTLECLGTSFAHVPCPTVTVIGFERDGLPPERTLP
jgi:uncharacterized repeat protein (TIGR04042 family)